MTIFPLLLLGSTATLHFVNLPGGAGSYRDQKCSGAQRVRTDQHLWSSQGFSLATSLSSKLLFTHLRRDPVCIPVHTEDQQTSFNFASSCLSLTCLKGRITLDSCSLILTQFDFHQNANKVLLSSISLEELTSKAYGSCVCKTI